MSKQHNRILRQTALAAALGVCFASPLYAQSNTTGNVFGTAAAGSTVTVVDPSTGVRREVVVDNSGNYRAASLPPGTYDVTVRNADGTTATQTGVAVQLGVGTPVNFTGAPTPRSSSGATNVGTVRVRGSRAITPIDVKSTESVTVLSSAQIARIPVSRDTTSVALLAPGTVRGDAAFGNLASFGGASVAENQYFVNGFNVTNTFRSLNFSKVPFEGIAEQQVKTGGYGAEFGRSLGGVVNQVTKRGTNEFKGGIAAYYTPSAQRPDRYYAQGTEAGKLLEDNSKDESSSWNLNVWGGGALIKDKLFAYGLIGYTKSDSESYGTIDSISSSSGASKAPNWLVKLDYNLNDSNTLEYTGFADTTKSTTTIYDNPKGSFNRTGVAGSIHNEQGGINHILKWTSFLTDNFSISALYGHGEFKRNEWLTNRQGQDVRYGGDIAVPATGCPIITDARPAARRNITGNYDSKCNVTGGAINRADSGDTRDQYRIDADWKLGDHALRFGIDVDNYESVAGTSFEGGKQWRYSTLANGTDIVRLREIRQGTTVAVKQKAFYIQDSWSVTDNFLAYLGLRWDTFQNFNGDGDKYVEIKNQLGPRMGFSWDVNGDSTMKIYGSAGRYALPLTPSVAVRGASKSLFSQSTWFFTGVDPVTGAPTGLTPRTGTIYLNGEDGKAKNPLTIASKNLKPMYQDEFILGMQAMVNDNLSVGTRAVYRNLKQAIDDNCDYAPIMDALEAQGYDTSKAVLPNPGFPYCRMFNPGADAIYVTDPDGKGKLYETLIKGDLLSPKAKRTYQSLEVFADGHGDRYSWHASYTWSASRGNTEGGVKSDIGQADTSTTQDFDYKELTVDTYGYLPNDRRHAFKAFGNYDLTNDFSVGANFLWQSGRPYNCFGTLPWPDSDGLHNYGASFMRCGGQRVPRGTAGRLPNMTQLDLNLVWTPGFMPGLTIKADVFNIFNRAAVTAVSEIGEDGAIGPVFKNGKWVPIDTYLLPRSFQAPRSYRLMFQYTF